MTTLVVPAPFFVRKIYFDFPSIFFQKIVPIQVEGVLVVNKRNVTRNFETHTQ